jgi:hypothetical protein
MSTTCEKLANAYVSEEERALLVRGEWKNCDVFTDADVSAVKETFSRVFSDERALVGSTYSDALVMQPKQDSGYYYAMMVKESGVLEWKKAHTTNEGVFQAANGVSFDLFLELVGYYDSR